MNPLDEAREKREKAAEILENEPQYVQEVTQSSDVWDAETNQIVSHSKFNVEPRMRQVARYMIRDKMSENVIATVMGIAYMTVVKYQKRTDWGRIYKSELDLWETAGDITRREVVEGMKDAIEIARLREEPSTMVAGWREIGKIVGIYEPQKIDHTHGGTVKLQVEQMEQMSDEELLALMDDDVIEGELVDESKEDTGPQDTGPQKAD